MSDLIVNLINLNENINYSTLVSLFCSYLITLWIVISVWVGVDAYRRFNNKMIALAFFLLTFLLNFPILIFYFIVRPEFKYEDFDEWEMGGVNVPIVNFKGRDGKVDMVLELKINPMNLVKEQSDMKIDVSWQDKNSDEFKLSNPENDVSKKELSKHEQGQADRKIITTFRNLSGFVSKRIERIKEISVEYKKSRKLKNKHSKSSNKKTKKNKTNNRSKKHPNKKNKRRNN